MTSTIRRAILAAVLTAVPTFAALIGEQVAGELNFGPVTTNFFDPAEGYVPASYLNTAGATVTIAEPAIEFGFLDGANEDVANFTDTQLVVSDDVLAGASPWTMRFTSVTPGLFTSLSLASEDFIPGLTYDLAGDIITIQWAGTDEVGLRSATFDVGSSGGGEIPEPGSMALLAGGLGLLFWLRRRA